MADTLVARPGEVRAYVFDFSLFPEIAQGDTLAGTPLVTATPAGLTVGAPAITGPRVKALITVGTAQAIYLVTCQCQTAGGATLVCEGKLEVST